MRRKKRKRKNKNERLHKIIRRKISSVKTKLVILVRFGSATCDAFFISGLSAGVRNDFNALSFKPTFALLTFIANNFPSKRYQK